jgi:Domain of unknown function (DUF5753)
MLQTQVPPFSPEEFEQRVQARLTRQDLLTQGESAPLRYHAVLDEAALHRQVGGQQIMAAQLRQLAASAELSNVHVQVIPFEAGAHPAMESNLSIPIFDQPLVSDVVYVEGLVGNIYLERPADIERYRQVFSRLRTMALNESSSVSLITRLAASYT